MSEEDAKPSRDDPPKLGRLQLLGSALAGFLLAFGGGGGIAATVEVFQDPDVPPQTCVSYWEDVKELGDAGFDGFDLMDDESELAERCGDPEKVDEAWGDDT